MLDIMPIVYVAGMAVISGVVDRQLTLVPLLLALIFPVDILAAAFVGMVVSIMVGSISKFARGAK